MTVEKLATAIAKARQRYFPVDVQKYQNVIVPEI